MDLRTLIYSSVARLVLAHELTASEVASALGIPLHVAIDRMMAVVAVREWR